MAQQYQVLARKWRPQQFDDVVGQEHVTTTLKNAIGQNRLAHAYLFVGPRGIGKTSTARMLPVQMDGWEEFETLADARRAERALKKRKSRASVESWLKSQCVPM